MCLYGRNGELREQLPARLAFKVVAFEGSLGWLLRYTFWYHHKNHSIRFSISPAYKYSTGSSGCLDLFLILTILEMPRNLARDGRHSDVFTKSKSSSITPASQFILPFHPLIIPAQSKSTPERPCSNLISVCRIRPVILNRLTTARTVSGRLTGKSFWRNWIG